MSEPAPRLRPFTGYLTTPLHADRVLGPPSALLTPEQRKAERHDPINYRNTLGRKGGFTKDRAAEWLAQRVADGVVTPVESVVVIYRHTRDEAGSLGFVAEVSLSAYDRGEIKKHEATIRRSQEKMVRYMARTRIYGKPVTLTYRSSPTINDRLETYRHSAPQFRLETVDGSTHDLWIIEGSEAEQLCAETGQSLYITDGHHRLAAASALARREERSDFIPAGLFSTNELELASFARCITDPGSTRRLFYMHLPSDTRLSRKPRSVLLPAEPGQLTARIGAQYVTIAIGAKDDGDPYHCLNTNRLHDEILEPLLGVDNPSSDNRLQYVSSDSRYDRPRVRRLVPTSPRVRRRRHRRCRSWSEYASEVDAVWTETSFRSGDPNDRRLIVVLTALEE